MHAGKENAWCKQECNCLSGAFTTETILDMLTQNVKLRPNHEEPNMTQKTSKRANSLGESNGNMPRELRQPPAPNLEERAAVLLGAYLAAAGFALTAYPETRHCMLRLTESVGAGAIPVYLFVRFGSAKALVVLATVLAVIIPWLFP